MWDLIDGLSNELIRGLTEHLSQPTVRFLRVLAALLVIVPGLLGFLVPFIVLIAGRGIHLDEVGSWTIWFDWILFCSAVVVALVLRYFYNNTEFTPEEAAASRTASYMVQHQFVGKSLLVISTVTVFAAAFWLSWTVHQGLRKQAAFATLISTLPVFQRGENLLKQMPLQQPMLVVVRDENSNGWLVKSNLGWGGVRLAQRPSEVMTLVEVLRRTTLIRTYTPAGEDYQFVFDCEAIDFGRGVVIKEATFVGSVPDNRSGSPAGYDVKHYGTEPWAEVGAWVSSLVEEHPAARAR